MTAAGSKKTVGVKADAKLATSAAQSHGSGIAVSHNTPFNSAVETYDLQGNLLGNRTQGDRNGPLFGVDQGTTYYSPEVSWNPANSGTLTCVGSTSTNAANGVGSITMDTSGDLQASFVGNTCQIAYMEFNCTGIPVGVSPSNTNGSPYPAGKMQLTVTASQISSTGSHFSGFPFNYGTLSTSMWVQLLEGYWDSTMFRPLTYFGMQWPNVTSGLQTIDMPTVYCPNGNVMRYVFIPRTSGGGSATISRSAGVKIKFAINRAANGEIHPWPGGFIVEETL